MTTRLFAVDMDGTLLRDSDKGFDRELFDRILTQLQQENKYFVLASGNQYPKLKEYVQGFENRGIYYIAENGAYIADGINDLQVSGFTPETVEEVAAALQEFPQVGVVISTHEGAFVPRDRAEVISNFVRENLEFLGAEYPQGLDYLAFVNRFYPGTQAIDSFAEVSNKTIVKFALQTRRRQTQEILTQLIDRLPHNVVPVTSGFGSIDLISRGINKGSALQWMGKYLNVPAEEMMAFGDAANDIEMLHYAGTGIAMSNAQPEAKIAADHVIGNNNDGEVLKYIDQILNRTEEY